MRGRLVVFPIKGRNWCFSRSVDHAVASSGASALQTPTTLKELWKKINANAEKPVNVNVELVVDFASDKMNKAWTGLEQAPQGTLKNKLYGLGLKLLARVKPSEIFFKSITKEVSEVEIVYPTSLNARLVRRRLRHIASRGCVIHKKYLYASASLVPLTTAFTVLPLPNIPFFWVLFRTYSHWRALQGSERLLNLVSDGSVNQKSTPADDPTSNEEKKQLKSDEEIKQLTPTWVMQPSEFLDKLYHQIDPQQGLSQQAISNICDAYDLHKVDVLKYRDSM
ncbi:unnamed protein product [Rhodiola kirilowii]